MYLDGSKKILKNIIYKVSVAALIMALAFTPVVTHANESSTSTQETTTTETTEDGDTQQETTSSQETTNESDSDSTESDEEDDSSTEETDQTHATTTQTQSSTGDDSTSTSTQTQTIEEDDTSSTSTQNQTNEQDITTESATSSENGDTNSSSTQATTTVETGDAAANSSVDNTLNTNSTETNATSTSTDTHGSSTQTAAGTSTQQTASSTEFSAEESGGDAVTLVNASNTASVDNSGTTTAASGNNSASGSNTSVQSGDAVATANVVNKMNTNIVNSTGLIRILNNYFGQGVDDIDMRTFSFFQPSEDNDDTGGNLTVTNTNTTHASNTISVNADTGNNTAEGSSSAAVNTGDAFAGAHVVNLANTNIVDSRYLLLSFNSFGDFGGDVVFPNKEIFKRIYNLGDEAGGDTSVENTNTASTTNNINIRANSGNNTASGSSTDVTTERASARTNIVNQVNQNITGDNAFRVMFRVHGNFTGDLYNAPDGVGLVKQGPGMFALSFSPEKLQAHGDIGNTESGGNMDVQNKNTAEFLNNISVSANTGGNQANAKDAQINTGDAFAGANVVNAANTNVLGRNWMTAIVNVFGDWDGSVSFGRPDLWVGARAEYVGDAAPAGSVINYHLTIANKGDATAHDVSLRSQSQNRYVRYEGTSAVRDWSIGTLKAGEIREKKIKVHVSPEVPPGTTMKALSQYTVQAREPDENTEDNTEQLQHYIIRQSSWTPDDSRRQKQDPPATTTRKIKGQQEATSTSRVAGLQRTAPPAVMVKREHNRPPAIVPGTDVTHTVTFDNQFGGPLHGAIGYDLIKDSEGNVVHQEVWEIGTFRAGEKIEAEYTMQYGTSTPPGTYTNTAYVVGIGGYASSTKGYEYESMKATSTIHILDTSKQRTHEQTPLKENIESARAFPECFWLEWPTAPYSIQQETMTKTNTRMPDENFLAIHHPKAKKERLLPLLLFQYLKEAAVDTITDVGPL